MNLKQYAKSLKSPLFADRASVDEAYEYAISMSKGQPEVLVAMQVMMNTIANDIERALNSHTTAGDKSELEQIVERWVRGSRWVISY